MIIPDIFLSGDYLERCADICIKEDQDGDGSV
jgi:hypothetical protein